MKVLYLLPADAPSACVPSFPALEREDTLTCRYHDRRQLSLAVLSKSASAPSAQPKFARGL
jgi:hypothetical protein